MHPEPRLERRALKAFGIGAGVLMADAVSRAWGLSLSRVHEEQFPDGERKLYPEESVEGSEVFAFASLVGPDVQDKILTFYFFLCALRDQGAAKVTAVVPYLPYARADRRATPFDTLGLRHIAELFESSGVHALAALDVHNLSAFENAFRCRSIHLEALSLFEQYAMERFSPGKELVILSPDIGGIKRAEKFRKSLERAGLFANSGFLEKYRGEGELDQGRVVGEVRGATVIVFDDMISTGATITRAAKALQDAGAEKIMVFATHGLFTAKHLLESPLIEEIVVTDSNPGALAEKGKLTVLSSASLFATLHKPALRERQFFSKSA